MTGNITWSIDTTNLQRMLKQSPSLAYKELRELLFQYWHGHRQYWLSKESPRFGRGGRGVKVHKVGGFGKQMKPREVRYFLPNQRRVDPTKALKGLNELNASEVRSDSKVLKLLTLGGKVRARKHRYMTKAVRTRPSSYKKWADKYPAKVKNLRHIPAKRGKHQVRIYEVTGKRKKKWRLRFIQIRQVRNKPTLQFYKSWDDLQGRRNREFTVFSNRLVRQMLEVSRGKSA